MPLHDMIGMSGDESAPIRTEPMQQRSADRLTTILDAASLVVDEIGFERITTAMIAERAGASIGTVYRYFPDRVAVLQALRERAINRFRARLTEQMGEHPPQNWWDAIDFTVMAFSELYRSEPGFRVIHFIDRERMVQAGTEEIAAGFLAHRLASLLAEEFGLEGGADLIFRLEIVVETADSLISRAFQMDPNGDERFIDECRKLLHDYLVAAYGPVTSGTE